MASQPNPYANAYDPSQYYAQQQPLQITSPGPANSLWMGDVETWMDENYIMSLFTHYGDVVSVKIIRDKGTGFNVGYCFVYFQTPQGAQRVMETLNGHPIPGTNRNFKLNWATYGAPKQATQPRSEPHSLFVGDLAPDVTDHALLSTFQYYYPSVYSARVILDQNTRLSKGFGFVYFSDETQKNRALVEMQGFQLSYKPIKLNVAATKKTDMPPTAAPMGTAMPPTAAPTTTPTANSGINYDPTNNIIFIGGIDPSVTVDLVRSYFAPFGPITSVKIPHGKFCSFVEFVNHQDAQRAIVHTGGTMMLGYSQVRVAWGKPPKHPGGGSPFGAPSAPFGQPGGYPYPGASPYPYPYGYPPHGYPPHSGYTPQPPPHHSLPPPPNGSLAPPPGLFSNPPPPPPPTRSDSGSSTDYKTNDELLKKEDDKLISKSPSSDEVKSPSSEDASKLSTIKKEDNESKKRAREEETENKEDDEEESILDSLEIKKIKTDKDETVTKEENKTDTTDSSIEVPPLEDNNSDQNEESTVETEETEQE